jgi:hypothetical protein
MLPLSGLEGGGKRTDIFIRNNASSSMNVLPGQAFTADYVYDSNPDDALSGWWVMTFTFEDDVTDRLPSVYFYSSDFVGEGKSAKEKFYRVFDLIRMHLCLPEFSPERIEQALKAFEKPDG